MAQPATLYFDILQEGTLVRSDKSDATAIKIGSHPKSHLHVEDAEVSRVHAVVEKSADGVSVIDLGSGRGTYVNGEKVSKRQLAHGDVIRLGNTEIRVFFRDERAAHAAAAAVARATDPATLRPRDEVLYARRFLAKPATSDGSVEIAVLYRDHVMAEELYRPPQTVTLGPAATDTFCVEDASIGEQSFTFIDASGGEPVLHIAAGMVGEVYVGAERRALGGAAERIPLTSDTRARVAVGELVFFVHRSTRPALALPLARTGLDGLGYVGFSAVLHAILLALIMLLPPGMGSLSLDAFGAQDRFVQFMLEEEEPEPEPEQEVETDSGEDEEQQLEEGDEGRAGDEREEDTNDRMAVEGDLDPNQDIELARMEARDAVQDRGALAVLNQAGPTSLFGGTANGYDAVMAIGSVSGADIGASYGSRGLGAYGGGLSGGGRQLAGIGSGPLALRGRASGGDSDLGRNMRGVRDREARQPTVSLQNPTIEGQLDREIIQRVIREHRREVRACYEEALQRDADLEGRVVVAFLIAPSGRVAAANVAESTLRSDEVETCLTRRVRQWRFPEPRGGGSVNVNYPFVFSAG
jgi:TonB family protein